MPGAEKGLDMSFDLPEGGDAANNAPDQPKDAFHQEAASDFDGGREAHAGESGAECLESGVSRGAPPGNTAPHTCKASAQPTFKLVRLAVDSLYLSYPCLLYTSHLFQVLKRA